MGIRWQGGYLGIGVDNVFVTDELYILKVASFVFFINESNDLVQTVVLL